MQRFYLVWAYRTTPEYPTLLTSIDRAIMGLILLVRKSGWSHRCVGSSSRYEALPLPSTNRFQPPPKKLVALIYYSAFRYAPGLLDCISSSVIDEMIVRGFHGVVVM